MQILKVTATTTTKLFSSVALSLPNFPFQRLCQPTAGPFIYLIAIWQVNIYCFTISLRLGDKLSIVKGDNCMRNKILIADDEERMRRLVGDFLRREGYQIMEAADGREALEIFEADQDICLVILDVMMPVYDGWAVCREIRKKSMIPIIMLTARGEETDELFGFELGADEYISKPFSPQVLIARVQALLRRASGGIRSVFAYPGLEIDVDARRVKVDDEFIMLSPKEFELLSYMAANEGRALSRDQILNAVWDYNFYGDPRTVDTHVKKVRLKLGSRGEYIQTVRGVGYRFEVPND